MTDWRLKKTLCIYHNLKVLFQFKVCLKVFITYESFFFKHVSQQGKYGIILRLTLKSY